YTMERIIITGALGQIGTELTLKLREKYGEENVLPTDIKEPEDEQLKAKPFERLDVRDMERLKEIARDFKPDTIMHMAALLSATCEKDPQLAWDINMGVRVNALEPARESGLEFFTPSCSGAFGLATPKENTPQVTVQRPGTVDGVSKGAGELPCDYSFEEFGAYGRGVRYPGPISHAKAPG